MNPPEARNFGFRIGSIISRDMMFEQAQELRRVDFNSKSAFSYKKTSPRGIKHGPMQLARGLNGGFYNPKTLRQEIKVQVEEVLHRQSLSKSPSIIIADDEQKENMNMTTLAQQLEKEKDNKRSKTSIRLGDHYDVHLTTKLEDGKFSPRLERALKEGGQVGQVFSNSPRRSNLDDMDRLSIA